MTKPSKSKSATKAGNVATDSGDDTLKLKKQAAAPGVIAATDVGTGKGEAAAMRGGEVKPVESTLLGKAEAGRPAAMPKSGADKAQAKVGADPVVLTSATQSAKVDDKTPAQDAGRDDKGAAVGAKDGAVMSGSSPVPAQAVTGQKTGFWPTLLGGVAAAGVGALVTYGLIGQRPAIDLDAIRAEATGAAETALAQALEARDQRIAALEAQGTGGGDAAAEAVTQLQAQLDQQAGQIEELASRPALDPELAARIQALTDQAGALQQQIQTAAAQAQTQISAAQAEATKLQEAAQDSTRRAEAVAAIATLQAALDRGVTAGEAQQTLEGVGIDTPAALQQEVPSLTTLQAGFGEAARAALRATLREDSAQGGNILTNFLRAQTGARSVEPRDGDDADAILSRAHVKVEAGDIAGALDETAALPDPAAQAPAMAEWLAGAQAYRDAHAALNDLSTATN